MPEVTVNYIQAKIYEASACAYGTVLLGNDKQTYLNARVDLETDMTRDAWVCLSQPGICPKESLLGTLVEDYTLTMKRKRDCIRTRSYIG